MKTKYKEPTREQEEIIKLYIKNMTKETKCSRCERNGNLYQDSNSYEFYCLGHLKEMLLGNDGEVLNEYACEISGCEDEN